MSTKPGKYQPLADYLAVQPGGAVTLTFAEVEAILGAPLPLSAGSPTWWTNSPTMEHARLWQAAGWRRDQVHIAAEWVSFRRVEPPAAPPASMAGPHRSTTADT